MITRGNSLPRPQGFPPLAFHQYVIFNLHNHYFIGPFEMGAAKICEIKIEKNTTTCLLSTEVDPAKRGTKRVRTEPAMSNF
jgi:hypothetical protein